ncbi:hypothetical protein [Yunchengibacter salinarum]|uniref:hypothetical protein n=1 Tax=Yunchengibacter salinarum TaxID=3133399 RepID=UPI0035B6240A
MAHTHAHNTAADRAGDVLAALGRACNAGHPDEAGSSETSSSEAGPDRRSLLDAAATVRALDADRIRESFTAPHFFWSWRLDQHPRRAAIRAALDRHLAPLQGPDRLALACLRHKFFGVDDAARISLLNWRDHAGPADLDEARRLEIAAALFAMKIFPPLHAFCAACLDINRLDPARVGADGPATTRRGRLFLSDLMVAGHMVAQIRRQSPLAERPLRDSLRIALAALRPRRDIRAARWAAYGSLVASWSGQIGRAMRRVRVAARLDEPFSAYFTPVRHWKTPDGAIAPAPVPAFAGLDRLPRGGVAVLVSATEDYYDRYGAGFMDSVVQANRANPAPARLHLHGVGFNPDPADAPRELTLDVTTEPAAGSHRPVRRGDLASLSRYLLLPDLLDRYDRVIVSDIDGVLSLDAPDWATIEETDRILIRADLDRPGHLQPVWNMIAAGRTVWPALDTARAIALDIRHWLLRRIAVTGETGERLFFADQMALAHAWHRWGSDHFRPGPAIFLQGGEGPEGKIAARTRFQKQALARVRAASSNPQDTQARS